MSRFNLEINSLVTFDTLEEARAVGRAIDLIIAGANPTSKDRKPVGVGDEAKSVRIYEAGSFRKYPLVKPAVDKSKFRVGGQEAEAKINGLIKEIEKNSTNPTIPAAVFWETFIEDCRQAGEVDLVKLDAKIAERFPAEDSTAILANAASALAAAEATRTIVNARNLKAARERKAAAEQRTKKN